MRQYYLYCDACGFKGTVDERPQKFGEGLYEYQVSPCPGRIPYRDRETQEVVSPGSINLMPKFRCPGCGRAVSARKVHTLKRENDGKDPTRRREGGPAGPEIPADAP